MARVRDLPGLDAPDSLASALRRFIEWMGTRNYSVHTIASREVHLAAFILWCAERGVGRPRDVTHPILERYRRWLYHHRKADGAPLSFRTQAGRLTPVRAFFKWLAREGVILFNPAAELDLPRPESRLPQAVLTAAEAEAVLAAPDLTTPHGVRDRALLELLYATGMRRLEAAELKVWDVDYARSAVTIRQGKGRKDRVAPLGERAKAWLARYRDEARPQLVAGKDPDVLFLSRFGEPFEAKRLTKKVRRYMREAGIDKPGACHLLRHSCATLMLENGADIRFIQALLGHESLETTQIYTRVSIAKLAEIHAATHPGARLGPDQARQLERRADLLDGLDDADD
jgi:integrase/recombinase XerD